MQLILKDALRRSTGKAGAKKKREDWVLYNESLEKRQPRRERSNGLAHGD
jgi:hypothetical protein